VKFPLMRSNFHRDDLDAVIEHLKQDDPKLTHGQNVKAFEQEWSQWLGVKYSTLVNSGASANLLTIAILKHRFPDGGEVIVPPLTWSSDISALLFHGFEPVFADIDPRTLSMATDKILAAITDRTRAVFITHAQGFNGLTDHLLLELERRDILLIEDVCESHGARHKGRLLGSFGWVSNFSFYYAHHMSTIEGGMICTNDEKVHQAARMLRSHGMLREADDEAYRKQIAADEPELNPDFIFVFPGYNCRNTEIGGILGRKQLKRLDANNIRRTENFKRFLDLIDKTAFRTDFEVEGSSNYAFNLIQKAADFDFSNRLMARMREAGIEFRRGSAGGGNQLRQPYLRGRVPLNHHLAFPETEHVHFFGYYIGNFPELPVSDIEHITAVINSV